MLTPFRRSVLPPLLLVLVPLSLLQTLWGLLPLPGADPARLINGVLVRSPAGWLEVLVVAVAWTWAVTAGVAAIGGANRPLRRAMRRLPTVCGALFAGVAAVLIAFLLVGLVLPAGVEVIWVAAVLLAAVLWTCVDYRCRSPREVPLTDAPESSGDLFGPSPGDAFLLAVNPDGRVIVARQQVPDQIVTVRL